MGLREEIKRQVNVCLDELRRDALGEESLRHIAELADGLAGGGRTCSTCRLSRPRSRAG